ncbi:hypothetical protein VZH09_04695 [Synechococcus elongatus IITB7]|uniref:hypothetical protein n=1 Tax=Synechococcus elongatus TaxID=32046 RepID=UPI0030D58C69
MPHLPRNPRRRDIIRFARECGWSIEPAGSEQLKATRPGYVCVPIPGHNDNKRIPVGTANAVAKQLLYPLRQDQVIRDLRSQVAELEQHLTNISQDRDRLALQQQKDEQLARLEKAEEDQQVYEELLLELEERNNTLKHWFGKRTKKLRQQLQEAKQQLHKAKRQAASALKNLQRVTAEKRMVDAELKLILAALEQVEAVVEQAATQQARGGDTDQLLQTLLGRLQHILEIKELDA